MIERKYGKINIGEKIYYTIVYIDNSVIANMRVYEEDLELGFKEVSPQRLTKCEITGILRELTSNSVFMSVSEIKALESYIEGLNSSIRDYISNNIKLDKGSLRVYKTDIGETIYLTLKANNIDVLILVDINTKELVIECMNGSIGDIFYDYMNKSVSSMKNGEIRVVEFSGNIFKAFEKSKCCINGKKETIYLISEMELEDNSVSCKVAYILDSKLNIVQNLENKEEFEIISEKLKKHCIKAVDKIVEN